MVQEPESTAGGLLPLEFWVVVFMFPLGWHTDTYHTVVYDGGAFELCLPSLGNLYQNSLLRTQYLGSRSRSTWSCGEHRRLSDRVTLCMMCDPAYRVCGVGLPPTVDVGLEV
jgi:hypothetical protein